MLLWKKARLRGLSSRGYLLCVDVHAQVLRVWSDQGLRAQFPVSTAAKGVGARAGSNKTPPGWHRIVQRIGHDRPAGSVYVARKYTGEIVPARAWNATGKADRILSRILRLRGLEGGRNLGPGIDSFRRFIYIHGTNQEQFLGCPASHGCIRMGNRDIVRLFRLIRGRPAWCWIGYLPAHRRD